MVIGFQITGMCTLKCAYCYAHKAPKVFVPLVDVRRIADELVFLGLFSISIEGGEPLLHSHWFDIAEIFVRSGIEVAILTNGTICDDETIKSLLDLSKRPGSFSLQVSLDSVRPQINNLTRGKSSEVYENIHRMVDAGLDLTIATVVHSVNMPFVFEILENLNPGIRRFHFMNLMSTPSHDAQLVELAPKPNELADFWKRLLQFRKQNPNLYISTPFNDLNLSLGLGTLRCKGCTAGTTRATISPDLLLLPCGLCPDWVIGDLKCQSLEDVWNGENARRIRQLETPPCRISTSKEKRSI